ncbi:MAG TPA: hypothetical protein VMF07_13025 [Solirubrobacteraceae bacterium]|nr:hypothetical protein [Solirubrobacteraceae bacterium]
MTDGPPPGAPDVVPSDAERALVQAYELLVDTLREHADDLPPFAARNAVKAAAALWQVANGLGLDPEHPYELGL